MKRLYTICCLAVSFLSVHFLNAQNHFQVEVSNFKFTPQNLTVEVGDTVTWTNVQGSHNVNGSTATFPNNSNSFKNAVAGPGWKYTYVFTEAGVQQYLCDPHASFMAGTVTVNSTTGISESESANISIFPNPAKAGDFIQLSENEGSSTSLQLYDVNGKLLSVGSPNKIEIPNGTKAGYYIIKLGNFSYQLIVVE